MSSIFEASKLRLSDTSANIKSKLTAAANGPSVDGSPFSQIASKFTASANIQKVDGDLAARSAAAIPQLSSQPPRSPRPVEGPIGAASAEATLSRQGPRPVEGPIGEASAEATLQRGKPRPVEGPLKEAEAEAFTGSILRKAQVKGALEASDITPPRAAELLAV